MPERRYPTDPGPPPAERLPGLICEECGHDHLCYDAIPPQDFGFCCQCDGLWDADDQPIVTPCSPWWVQDPDDQEDGVLRLVRKEPE